MKHGKTVVSNTKEIIWAKANNNAKKIMHFFMIFLFISWIIGTTTKNTKTQDKSVKTNIF